MEENKNEEFDKDTDTTSTSEETSDEEQQDESTDDSQDDSTDEDTDDSSQDTDTSYNVAPEPEKAQGRSELEKAEYTLKSVRDRVKELGGDPDKILGTAVAPETEDKNDPQSLIRAEFAQRDARAVSSNEQEYQAIMSWINKGLSVEDAKILANKGRLKDLASEIERGNQRPGSGASVAPQRQKSQRAPSPTPELLKVWQRRGFKLNSKTGTYQGKFNEMYYDHEAQDWRSRRIT